MFKYVKPRRAKKRPAFIRRDPILGRIRVNRRTRVFRKVGKLGGLGYYIGNIK